MDVGNETDQYIPRIKWLPNSKQLCVTRLNRRQNDADLIFCDGASGESINFHTENDKRFLQNPAPIQLVQTSQPKNEIRKNQERELQLLLQTYIEFLFTLFVHLRHKKLKRIPNDMITYPVILVCITKLVLLFQMVAKIQRVC